VDPGIARDHEAEPFVEPARTVVVPVHMQRHAAPA
jgi:hypothetical protein